MQRVNVGSRSLADYSSLIGRTMADEIRMLAEPLRGRRMLHLSATAFGGGVAEIQYTLIPLLNDVGIEAEWRVIQGQNEFFDVTKTIHNALQGDSRSLTPWRTPTSGM
jgi:trehalose synthase